MKRTRGILPRVRPALLALLLVPAPAVAAEHVVGTTGPGAPYSIDVPDGWNGDLVLYAHGIVPPAAPVAPPTTQDRFEDLRDAWLDLGYAVAASGYSQNGFALKDGAQRTHQIGDLFVSRFGRPHRVYLVGHSLGAGVALDLAERFPGEFDGALLLCGLVGGTRDTLAYLADARVLFDYFFPGVLPGDAFHVPAGLDFFPGSPTFAAAYGAILAGFAAPGQPTLQLARVARLPGTTPDEIVASALTVAGFSVLFTNDLLARTHGHIPFDNTQTRYAGSADDDALNAGVERFASSPDAVHYIDLYYTPTGDLRFPALTLHTTRDPEVPFFNEAAYAQVVAAAGASDRLVQRSLDRYGHCAFTVGETIDAFRDLSGWVLTGIPPVGGEPIP